MGRTTIIEQQQRHGRKVMAVLPIHYPKEMLTALDILAVELWGPPGPPRGPDVGRIQPYVCAIVRNALAFLAAGGADRVDGLLFPHTCDSIQGLATQAPDFGGWGKAVFRYIHPKGDERPSARRFVRRELEHLAADLETFAGKPLRPDALRDAIVLHRRIRELRLRLADRRAFLDMTDHELYTLLRRGEFLWPEDHLAELETAAARLRDEPVQQGVPLMITGIVPEPMAIFDAIAEAGGWVAADDYAGLGRRLLRDEPRLRDDPFGTLVDLQFAGPPCPTRTINQTHRLEHIQGELERSGAVGLVIHEVKFCEPELFDVPLIRRLMAERGTPVLYMETELERELSGQAVTRLEAFVEMQAPVRLEAR
jgi:benzoyl-CoA reductase/2-hydroxyglutaryl-CoA dehydratase subunit BcrC/BadD/HgdB